MNVECINSDFHTNFIFDAVKNPTVIQSFTADLYTHTCMLVGLSSEVTPEEVYNYINKQMETGKVSIIVHEPESSSPAGTTLNTYSIDIAGTQKMVDIMQNVSYKLDFMGSTLVPLFSGYHDVYTHTFDGVEYTVIDLSVFTE